MIDLDSLTPERLASLIDHTFLQPSGPPESIERLCGEAARYGFAMVAVNPAEVARCVRLLAGSTVRVGAAIGFPLGQSTLRVKLLETSDAIENGAREVDMVINQRALRAGEHALVEDEIAGVADACRDHGVISKVILECCNLEDDEKLLVCEFALRARCDFVKTSTGFGKHGATVKDVRLMREKVGRAMGVKAAGGIRSLDTALEMIRAGATRIGTSSGTLIVDEFRHAGPGGNSGPWGEKCEGY